VEVEVTTEQQFERQVVQVEVTTEQQPGLAN
jgi:hypothetical protein